jgi:hypothetical protein
MQDRWDCFISYPATQQHVAAKLAELLSPRVAVFFDQTVLRPGDDWPRALARALDHSLVTAVIVSPQTERAFYEQEEIVRAIQRAREHDSDRRVVPLFVDGISPTDTRVPFGLRVKQGYTIESSEDIVDAADGIVALVGEISDGLESNSTNETRALSPSIRDHLARLRVEADQLTKEQYRTINQLRHMKRVRISGCAGSGKTLVAAEKATRLAGAGLRVLFLCHNPLLAEHVQQLTAGTRVEVRDFSRWVVELTEDVLDRDNREWTHYDEPDQTALDVAFEQLTAGRGVVDAVVVDEGQDFRTEWWTLIEAALRQAENGSLYIFHDNNQSLLAHRSKYPIDEPHIDLSRNCRNAGRILELMRCFDSSAPEPELGLRSKGRALLRRYEYGNENVSISEALAYLDQEGLLDEAVVLLNTDKSLDDSGLSGYETQIATCDPWQEEIRRQFSKILHLYSTVGVVAPSGGEHWVGTELNNLTGAPFPTPADAELVQNVANAFSLTRNIRARIIDNTSGRGGFNWHLSDRSPRLRRKKSGPPLAAEVLLHFARPDWMRGLPKPKTFVLQPFYVPRAAGTIPVYRVSDFKGLEAEAVLLIIRGRMDNQREATYVGLSRARALLYVIADQSALTVFPRTFAWDQSMVTGSRSR